MALDASNSSNLEQMALNGLIYTSMHRSAGAASDSGLYTSRRVQIRRDEMPNFFLYEKYRIYQQNLRCIRLKPQNSERL